MPKCGGFCLNSRDLLWVSYKADLQPQMKQKALLTEMCALSVNIPWVTEAFPKCAVSEKMSISCKFSCFSEITEFFIMKIKRQLCNGSFFFFFPELFDSKSWKLQITHKTGVSKFCLPMGLYW